MAVQRGMIDTTGGSTPMTEVPRLTREQAAIIGFYTGVLCGPFKDVQQYAEGLAGRPISTLELGTLFGMDPALYKRLKKKALADLNEIAYRKEAKDPKPRGLGVWEREVQHPRICWLED